MWTLRPDVYGVAVDDDLVFLDLGQDEYFCLRGRGEVICLNADGSIDGLTDQTSSLLDAHRLIQPGSPSRPEAKEPPAKATRDLLRLPDRPIGWRASMTVPQVLMDLRRLGADPPVRDLLTLTHRGGLISETRKVADAALTFRAVLPWLPIRGQCLKRSALLVAFLRRRGVSASWVFGVRTWPFRAHCWVQQGDVCLNDDADRLRAYTPVLFR